MLEACVVSNMWCETAIRLCRHSEVPHAQLRFPTLVPQSHVPPNFQALKTANASYSLHHLVTLGVPTVVAMMNLVVMIDSGMNHG